VSARSRHLLLLGLAGALVGVTACGSDDPDPVGSDGGDRADVSLGEKPTVDVSGASDAQELIVDDLVVGDGAEAAAGTTVSVHYVGVAASTGEQFDASWDRRQPLPFRIGAGMVIEGWDRGVEGMRVGGRRQLTIPADLAYGDRGVPGTIAPGETLVFVVDLLEVG
jgi:peptidylprolyl isomerase